MASSKRERELARMRAERQAARRQAAEARRRQRNATLASAAAVVVVLALVIGAVLLLRGGSSKKTAAAPAAPVPTPVATASASPAADKPGTCTYTKSGTASKKLGSKLPPTTGVNHTKAVAEKIITSQGEVDVRLLATKAPCTVNNFTALSAFHFFDATPCHRLTTQGIFVVQCGDPSGTGSGGPGWKFKDENLKGATYPRGTLAMANSGPDTNGSQFFLVYKDSQLPPSYTPFGTITKGLNVLDKIAAGGSIPAGDGKPKIAVRIVKAVVAKA